MNPVLQNIIITMTHVGDWFEPGLLESFKRKGITNFSAISEIIANSIDANCANIILKFEPKHFKIIDDGNGMCNDKIKSMFSNYKENHSGDRSMGIVGIGGKLANAYLSKYKNPSVLYTKSSNGDFLKIDIPWDEIYTIKKYTGMISINKMTLQEISEFKKDIML